MTVQEKYPSTQIFPIQAEPLISLFVMILISVCTQSIKGENSIIDSKKLKNVYLFFFELKHVHWNCTSHLQDVVVFLITITNFISIYIN